ncbi:PREDICTED: probable ATP-dependent RNA helicase kurz [Nicrophorus vespilloides]|uniref:RNA helicase n=1 Tax=Nicrophorus vespilloides TaxID=110193 RepID=A0ABM1MS67_NICVS|nr:PREDICTED: probable ATP-dependent RNA helicase kurz [Nicrophorus vespilloides]
MGKSFNWKARQVKKVEIDNTSTNKIKLDIEGDAGTTYDGTNALVLPSEKRKTKVKKEKNGQITRILSKSHRKRLEKIVERRKKKDNRSTLLENLAMVQASPEELAAYESIASTQTKGLKRHFNELEFPQKVIKVDKALVSGDVKINSLAGSKRLRVQLATGNEVDESDPNVVGFEEESSDSESEAEDENNGTEEMETCEVQEVKDNEEETVKEEEETVKEEEETIEEDSQNQSGCYVRNPNFKEEDVKKVVESKPAVFVEVYRTEEIQMARLKLPILAEEQQIMEIINENSVIILAGETGSGKTTQVPQFLYEAGYALNRMIAITEPRRVAAISMSKRVGEEMNLSSDEVSYLIRFEGNVTEKTKLKFMTDGVLLKEIQSDFMLTKYSVVILDEAHERSVYTDILIGFLSRIVPLRMKRNDPLKLIIMSATLRLEDFTENRRLFKNTPPVIKVEARQYPVTIHFNKRTQPNYLREVYRKTVKIHTTLPEGGILIFVTGQQEVKTLVRKLQRSFPLGKAKYSSVQSVEKDSDEEKDEELGDVLRKKKRQKKLKLVENVDMDDFSIPGDHEDPDVEEEDLEDDDENDEVVVKKGQPLWVLPLYSLLPSYKQANVFKKPPEGCRLCVVSTNVAETSLTIPDIKYVVDTGKTKVKLYDKVTGVSSYFVNWTSKASADQRAGRAGRTGPGHCYRLYSSAVFNDTFEKFSVPEIKEKPVDDLYLQLKCMGIDKVVNFPFPTVPDLVQLKTAESRLETLGALENSKVTPLGRAISKFPVLPRFGKMLALSHQQNLLPYTICMVAALSMQEVLLETPIGHVDPQGLKDVRQKWRAIRRQWAGVGNSLMLGDPMVLLKAVGAAEFANSEGRLERFCDDNGLRHKALVEIRKLRIQLTNEIKMNLPETDVGVDPKLKPPTDIQAKLLRQILLSGMGDQVAKKVMMEELKEDEDKAKYKYAYRANNMEEPVFLHQGSVLKGSLPEFVIYQEIYETNKMYMRGVTVIEPEWLAKYVPHLCNLGEPLTDPEPRYDSISGKVFCTKTGSFGTQAWPLPNVEVEFGKCQDGYKWFAKFFLEGQVCEALVKYNKCLLSQASTILKPWAKLQARTVGIVQALISMNVLTKRRLLEVWEENPKYLLNEYLQWLPESAHSEVTLLWPPISTKK